MGENEELTLLEGGEESSLEKNVLEGSLKTRTGAQVEKRRGFGVLLLFNP